MYNIIYLSPLDRTNYLDSDNLIGGRHCKSCQYFCAFKTTKLRFQDFSTGSSSLCIAIRLRTWYFVWDLHVFTSEDQLIYCIVSVDVVKRTWMQTKLLVQVIFEPQDKIRRRQMMRRERNESKFTYNIVKRFLADGRGRSHDLTTRVRSWFVSYTETFSLW